MSIFKNTKKAAAASYAFTSKLELQGRIQQLLIQKMVLTKMCNTWKQKCKRLERIVAGLNQDFINNVRDTNIRSNLKWIESEVLGI